MAEKSIDGLRTRERGSEHCVERLLVELLLIHDVIVVVDVELVVRCRGVIAELSSHLPWSLKSGTGDIHPLVLVAAPSKESIPFGVCFVPVLIKVPERYPHILKTILIDLHFCYCRQQPYKFAVKGIYEVSRL